MTRERHTGWLLRPGRAGDLSALTALENSAFTSDRISRRSFRNFFASPHAALIVAEIDCRVAGYALVLSRPRSRVARLYSIAVAREFAVRGVGRSLLAAAEAIALARQSWLMRLEVDERNRRAATLYRRTGYRAFGRRPAYYEDGGAALRFEKVLAFPQTES